MCLCGDIIGRQCYSTSGPTGTSWNHQVKGSSVVTDIGDPTGDTGKGAGETVPETWRDRTTGTARDSVAYEVVTMVREIEITA